ncbi:HCN2, partial [Symbiodinium microadriaticum]
MASETGTTTDHSQKTATKDQHETTGEVTFYTGFFLHGTLVLSRKLIAKNYIRGWLFFDVLYVALGLAWVVLQLSTDAEGEALSFMTALGS